MFGSAAADSYSERPEGRLARARRRLVAFEYEEAVDELEPAIAAAVAGRAASGAGGEAEQAEFDRRLLDGCLRCRAACNRGLGRPDAAAADITVLVGHSIRSQEPWLDMVALRPVLGEDMTLALGDAASRQPREPASGGGGSGGGGGVFGWLRGGGGGSKGRGGGGGSGREDGGVGSAAEAAAARELAELFALRAACHYEDMRWSRPSGQLTAWLSVAVRSWDACCDLLTFALLGRCSLRPAVDDAQRAVVPATRTPAIVAPGIIAVSAYPGGNNRARW